MPLPTAARCAVLFGDAPLLVLDTILVEVMRAYGIPHGRVVLGGMQMGGTGALRYARRCARGACTPSTQPAAVFAVDPVLDFLRDVAVRLYVEPDIAWHMAHRDDDDLSSNLADAAGLALLLRRLGNGHAELVAVSGRSVLPDGRPSPHAWNMGDEGAPARWVLAVLRPWRRSTRRRGADGRWSARGGLDGWKIRMDPVALQTSGRRRVSNLRTLPRRSARRDVHPPPT